MPAEKHLLQNNMAVVRGRDGWFMVNRNDVFIGRAIDTYGEYAGIELQTLATLVSEGDRIIEVGANIGAHTVGLATRVGRSGRVHAYEPQRACYAMLQGQLALNRLAHVQAFNLGVGAKEAVQWYGVPDYGLAGNFGSVALSPTRGGNMEAVRVMPLDVLHDRNEPVRLIKIDVEGMEAEVIAGGRSLINTQQPVLYVENDRPENSAELLRLIFDLGYRAWWHIPPLYNPNNFFGVTENLYGEDRSINMICLPRGVPYRGYGLREVRLEDPHPAVAW